MKSYWFSVTYKSNENDLKRDPQRYKEEGNMLMEAEIGATLPKTKECLQRPDAARKKDFFLLTALGGTRFLLKT